MKILQLFILLLIFKCGTAQETLQHRVLFDLDRSDLTHESEVELLNWLSSIPDSILKLEIIGYADFLGSSEYNFKLSEQRASHVLDFIEQVKPFRYQLSLQSAEGENHSIESADPNGNPADRKVEITVTNYPRKPGLTKPVVQKKLSNELPTGAIDLIPELKEGETVVLQNLNFFPGRHYLIPSALPELEKLVQILNDNPTLEIEIQGHICCKLDSIDGLDVNTRTYSLSANRAKYIFDQLVLAGINSNRVKHRGFAGSKPLVFPELTDTDRARNRRVEIMILKR